MPRPFSVTDGTEREIQRPKDPEKQIIFYSGRKKRHTVKNIVIADVCSKKVIYLSGTYEGKKHDRKIPDEENPAFPEGSTVVEPAETRFSKIPDFRGTNLKIQSVISRKKSPAEKSCLPEIRFSTR